MNKKEPAQQEPVAVQQSATNVEPDFSEPPIDFDDSIPFAPIGLQYPALLLAM